MLNSANMYPWYRDSMSQLGQFCSGNNLPAATAAHIKTENGYSDCMLALDYAQNKVRLHSILIMYNLIEKNHTDVISQAWSNRL